MQIHRKRYGSDRRLFRFARFMRNKYLGVKDVSNAERLKYYAGVVNGLTGEVTAELQQIQRDAITESVSVMFIHEAADKLTAAEAKALNNPGNKIPFRIQANARRSFMYYVEAAK